VPACGPKADVCGRTREVEGGQASEKDKGRSLATALVSFVSRPAQASADLGDRRCAQGTGGPGGGERSRAGGRSSPARTDGRYEAGSVAPVFFSETGSMATAFCSETGSIATACVSEAGSVATAYCARELHAGCAPAGCTLHDSGGWVGT